MSVRQPDPGDAGDHAGARGGGGDRGGAGPEVPPLPHTWRSQLGLVVAVAMGILLAAAAAGLWIAFPAEIRAKFSWPQTLTLLAFLAVLLFGLYRLGRMRARADETGLTIVNLTRTHTLEWAQVVRVNLRRGDPWVQLDLDDGTTVSVMAIQSADGDRARSAARQLARLVVAHSGTSRDD
ncbi:PH domain-containing protein [Actinopolymorpha cephalotaxi]|nr:PH domain-containing protein [Actinopolymorpha cephalotaxi]SFG31279.1 PH domain-containing protein [Actinopolymorpha cephalotaxi]